ncbi:hypothetical protein ACPB99_22455 [Streptomyces pseudogriseolus]|uniref:hypothetical protein n=1 Tax=Streptomyces pseudogriseolus TaxID=36817 RepID=UPI003FA32CE9
MTDLLHSRGRVSLFPDNTVLCNFGTVGRLDLLRKVLDGCGRWTEAVAEEARRSAAYVRDLARLEAEGWLGEPIELCTDAEIALADRLRRAVFGGLPTEPLRHLGEAETLALIQTRRSSPGLSGSRTTATPASTPPRAASRSRTPSPSCARPPCPGLSTTSKGIVSSLTWSLRADTSATSRSAPSGCSTEPGRRA